MALKQFLKDFNNSQVMMKDKECKSNNVDQVKTILEQIITCMKDVDPLFKELYQKIYYTGSYYEGLKVTNANEFDLNIVLKLPFKLSDIQVNDGNTVPKGYVMYKLTQPLECLLARHPKWDVFKTFDKIMDPTHMYLSQKNINCWLQSVVDKALRTNQAKFPNVKRSCSGPAKTLNITSSSTKMQLDVDLVPVVELNDFPNSVRKCQLLTALPRIKRTSFIVPKPPPQHIISKCPKDHDKLFRVSLPDAERFLMENKGCVKMLIKIFKVIRDKEQLTFIASYYIKTLFLWQLEKNPQADYWKEDNMDKLFLMMLQEFIQAMDKKSITHIFFSSYNLVAQLPQGAFGQAKIKLETLLKVAQSDVTKLRSKYLKT